MEFLDEDARPRFMFQSRAASSGTDEPQLNKPLAAVSVAVSSVLAALSLLYLESEPFKSTLLWLALSLLIGPFAPISVTGGDVRVGQGPSLGYPNHDPDPDPEDTRKRRSKPRRSEDPVPVPVPVSVSPPLVANGSVPKKRDVAAATASEDKDWTEEEVELLRKQLVKHPVGKLRRWEIVAEAFRGSHSVDGVIKMAKDLGARKVDDSDAYSKFLKNRKLDKRIETADEGLLSDGKRDDGAVCWTNGEDIALLNALKAFPKEASMRWEKIAAAVPGKTKDACVKRVSDLKKGFRTSKAGSDN